MNRIVAIGDIHGDSTRVSFRRNPDMRKYDENDVIVFLGDWGLVFGHYNLDEEKYHLGWLNNQKYKSIVVMGNHDDYDWAETLPEVEAFGTTMKQAKLDSVVYENIYIVDTWCIADICGKHCLLIAKADSHDVWKDSVTDTGLNVLTYPKEKWIGKVYTRKNKFYRVLGKSWWPQEHMDINEFSEFLEKNDAVNQHFDCIFSHDCLSDFNSMGLNGQRRFRSTPQEELFGSMSRAFDYDMWLHGHMHSDLVYPLNEKVQCVYRYNVEIGGNE